jgi:DNA polymerase alpha subunit A
MFGALLSSESQLAYQQMIASTTWSLTEMCQSHLKVERVDIDPEDLPDFFDPTASKPDKLIDFIQHCEADSFFQMAIANKVQALPLTKQLTNLAGNSWNRTLGGGRAERNEYILLHEFHKGKFICPDKISRWEKKQAKASADPEDDDDGKGKSKRDKFKGGLVFEPKRGLWDKFILVMDFNSLYPSIIQEFNIDFTTVERTPSADVGSAAFLAAELIVSTQPDEPEKIPEVPTIEERGVLPRLIRTLVERRKAVKSLMKDPHAGPAKQLEVRSRGHHAC